MDDKKLCVAVNSASSFLFGHRILACKSVAKEAPNRLLNWIELKKVVEPNLRNCNQCGGKLQLHHSLEQGIAPYVHLYCVTCTMNVKKRKRRLDYCRRNLDYYYLKKDRDPIGLTNRRKKVTYAGIKLQHAKDALKSSNAPDISSRETNTFMTNESNVRTALATYYMGVGPRDIGNSLGFYGIPGGHSFHGLYYENMDEINKNVMEVCEEIVQEGLLEEIKCQIKKQLGDKYTAEEVIQYTHNFLWRQDLYLPKY